MPTKVSERMKCIGYLFLPIGFVKYQHEQEGLEKNSTHHTTPKSLNGEKISEPLVRVVFYLFPFF